jgi:hypothetical protein
MNLSVAISGDTLYIRFVYLAEDEGEKNWMKRMDLVRIFAPELRYVEAHNTNFEMEELKQKSISANISGRSKFEVESFITDIDSIAVIKKDTAEVVFDTFFNGKFSFICMDNIIDVKKIIDQNL